ncbi:MAG: NAD(P)H-dependent oxidoreductase [Candidatus Cloacimonetes bacterium]|nr:NAD(P)H-dependent oxidoreductase [Candidatus Cloacimonadota bacterium]
MKYLIIYAHPREDSFNHAILEQISASLSAREHEVKVRDLYKENFNPLLSAEDLTSFTEKEIPADILIEQEYISWADKVIIIHPIWWFSMPAMMKGYIDRILIAGFAYKYTDGHPVGLFAGKPVLLINSTGNSDEIMEIIGIKTILNNTIDKGIYEFCGFQVNRLFLAAVPYVGNKIRKEYLKLVEDTLDNF